MRLWLFRFLAHLVAPNKQEKKIFSILTIVGLVFFASARAASAEVETESWVNSILDVFAGILTTLAMVVGQVAIFLIGVVTIPLLQYNSFVTSPVVGMGWAVVRDAVNMFYVIILILIAFGTILGIDRFKWREQIPRLLGTAIVINFSRTLCGIMIDFSQVMTLTFVNAIKDIAGGNFVQLFGITSILEANGNAEVLFGANGEGAKSFDIFAASVVALIMMLIVLITILFLTIIFAYRIVLIWALIIIAPLAWFFKGAKGVVDPSNDPYGKWWSRFKCVLQIGPILTFFLWLALAIAGSGDIGADFPKSSAPEGEGLDVGSLLKAMDTSNMVGFIVGIALIFVGFDAASDACGSDANIKGLLGTARSWVKPVATAPIAAAGLAAKYGWAGARGVQKGVYNQTIGRGVTKARNWAGGAMGTIAGHSLTPATLGHFLSKQSAKIKAKQTAEAEAMIKDKPLDTQSLITYLKKGPSAFDVNNRQYMARLKEAAGRDDVIDELGANGLKEILTKKMGKKTAEGQMLDTFAADPSVKKQMDALKKKLPTAFGAVEDIKDADDIKGMADSQLAETSVRERIGKMTKESDEAFTYIGKDGKTEKMSMAEAIMDGRLGRKTKDAWIKGEEITRNQRSPAALAQKAVADISVEKINGVEDGKLTAEDPLVTKILSEGDEKQVQAIGKKIDLVSLSPADRKKLLASVLRGRGAGARAKARGNLMSAGLKVSDAFSLQAQGDQLVLSEADKKDFEAEAMSNPQILAAALREVEAQGVKSNDVDSVIKSKVGRKAAQELLRRFRASTDKKEKENLKEDFMVLARKVFGKNSQGQEKGIDEISKDIELLRSASFTRTSEEDKKFKFGGVVRQMQRAQAPSKVSRVRESLAGGVRELGEAARTTTEAFVPEKVKEEIKRRQKESQRTSEFKEKIRTLQRALQERNINIMIGGKGFDSLKSIEQEIKRLQKEMKESVLTRGFGDINFDKS